MYIYLQYISFPLPLCLPHPSISTLLFSLYLHRISISLPPSLLIFYWHHQFILNRYTLCVTVMYCDTSMQTLSNLYLIKCKFYEPIQPCKIHDCVNVKLARDWSYKNLKVPTVLEKVRWEFKFCRALVGWLIWFWLTKEAKTRKKTPWAYLF